MSCKEIMDRNEDEMVILRRNEQLEHQNRQIINQRKQILDQQETIKRLDTKLTNMHVAVKLQDERIKNLIVILSARDRTIQEQSAALREQRKKSGWTEIQGIPALRVKDEYWVNWKGWIALADKAGIADRGYASTVCHTKPGTFKPLPVAYKEELD